MRDIENTKQHFPIKDSLTGIRNFEIEFCIQQKSQHMTILSCTIVFLEGQSNRLLNNQF